jgi:hypothetical protein
MKKIDTKLNSKNIKCECENFIDCFNCKKFADHHHHLFPNTKQNRRIYGDLIDQDFNIMFINSDCHLTRAIPHSTEIEFRARAYEAGNTEIPISKTLNFKKNRLRWDK